MDIITYIKCNKAKTIICFIVILTLLAAVWGSAFNSAQVIPQLLS